MRFHTKILSIRFNQDEFRRDVGEKLKLARRSMGLRQEDMAQVLHRSRAAYVNMEQGRQAISLEHLVRLAIVLKKELRDLLPTLDIDDPNTGEGK